MMEFSIRYLPCETRVPHGRGRGMITEGKGNRGYQETMTHQIKLTGLQCANRDWSSKTGSCMCLYLIPSIYVKAVRLVFCGTSHIGNWFIWVFWLIFPPIGLPCPALIWELPPCLIVSCFVLFFLPLRLVLFWRINRRKVDLDLEDSGSKGKPG